MTQRSAHVGVWLAAIASLVLWYALAWAALAAVDLGTRGMTSVLGTVDSASARWPDALEAALPRLETVIDLGIWTLWLLGSIGLMVTAGYAAWLLRQGAWPDRPRATARTAQARRLPDDVLP